MQIPLYVTRYICNETNTRRAGSFCLHRIDRWAFDRGTVQFTMPEIPFVDTLLVACQGRNFGNEMPSWREQQQRNIIFWIADSGCRADISLSRYRLFASVRASTGRSMPCRVSRSGRRLEGEGRRRLKTALCRSWISILSSTWAFFIRDKFILPIFSYFYSVACSRVVAKGFG